MFNLSLKNKEIPAPEKRGKAEDLHTSGGNSHQAWIDSMLVNMMICDRKSLEILYCNNKCFETSGRLKHVLPVTGKGLLGQSLDLLFGEGGAPREKLADARQFPLRQTVALGEEFLDVLITPVTSAGRDLHQLLITWHIITEQKKTDARAAGLLAMIENMPVNVLICDPGTSIINYANLSSQKEMRALAQYLPFGADALVGKDISRLETNPESFRTQMSDPARLPTIRLVKLGETTLKLSLSAINDTNGRYIGNMVIWEDVSEQIHLAERVRQMASIVAGASSEMENTAQHMSQTAQTATSQSSAAADSIQNATKNVRMVSQAAEELSQSIEEISRQVKESSRISNNAVEEAERTNSTVQSLSRASSRIGDVVKLIHDIAGQTNLLALNATIEAARAGEAGKGFAVVASEVKNLANQTAAATEEITSQISEMQASTDQAVHAIATIRKTIDGLFDIATAISASVEQQGSATREIAENISSAASDTEKVASNITGVRDSSNKVGQGVSDVLDAAAALVMESRSMEQEIDEFIEKVIRT